MSVEPCTRVVIADDRASCRAALRALFSTRFEIKVVGEAVDGEMAVQRVEELRPDVVVMDAKMPVLDGVEATRIIKTKWPWTRVVMLTNSAVCRADALAAHADAFLIKGDAPEELLRAVVEK
jgi:DNA-binding NarL/FixJ family response regulator